MIPVVEPGAHPSLNLYYKINGTPETIRTSDLCLRRAALYPAELRARGDGIITCAPIAWQAANPGRTGLQELNVLFQVSGVETQVWLPPLVAFVISVFTSMVGISGAILLLPFQMTFLGYTAPSVSGTNLVYNIFAIPSGE